MRRAHAVVASGWRCYGYVWFVGRADDVITSAAYRIGSFEVESALVEHPAVAEAAVVGKPVPLRGQIVKAYARARLHLTMHVSGSKSGVSVRTVRRIPDGRGASEVCAAVRGAVATVSDATARPLGENNMSALPLRPFGVPDLVWPSEICKACYQPQWSDALRDWEFVEDAAGPCVACQGRRVRGLGRNGRGSR